MEGEIQTIFNSKIEYNSNSEEFYKDYWQKGRVDSEDLSKQKYNAILKEFFPEGIKNKKVLEIGVGGKGGIIVHLKDENKVCGIDISDSAIFFAGELGLKVQKANLDTEKLPYENNSIDIIFAFEVFEHFANPQHAIEEINRVLIDEGILIISTPNPLTYHWPRLFYPQLFEKKAFKEFLMINGYDVAMYNDFMYSNSYTNVSRLGTEEKVWSYYSFAQKICSKDYNQLYIQGNYFWEQINDLGLRTRPVEAIELFRKSYLISGNLKAKLMLLLSLIYRLINNDVDEFFLLINELREEAKINNENKDEILYTFILCEIELSKHNRSFFSTEDISVFIDELLKLPEKNSNYISNIYENYEKLKEFHNIK